VIREDIRAGLERDPATRTGVELFLTSPGLHAIWIYRIAHILWRWNLRILARMLSNYARFFSGIEIHPGAKLGRRVVIDHGVGVVIGETAEIGDDVLIYHGVTLGGKTLDPVKRHPTVGNRVILGAGAKLIGNITVGDDCQVGANAVITKSIPAGSKAVGVGARIIRGSGLEDYAI
jgi:serine O-acetyltransferase